jgi:hypothetical protein
LGTVAVGLILGCSVVGAFARFVSKQEGAFSGLGEPALGLDPRSAPRPVGSESKLEGSFWTVPVLSEDGAVLFGIVRASGKSTNEVVVLDAHTGDVRSRAEIPGNLAMGTFTREERWSRDAIEVTELDPRVPFGAPFLDGALFAFAREWIVVDAKGGVRASGTLPPSVPEASPRAGICRMRADLWVGVEDPRGGGYRVDARSHAEYTRVDPPAGCARPITGANGERWSRAQQFHAAPPGRELFDCMAYEKGSSTRVNQCSGYFGEGPSSELVGNLNDRMMSDKATFSLDAPFDSKTARGSIHNRVRALETGAERVLFVAIEAAYDETPVVEPAKDSFEAPTRTKGRVHRGAVVALDAQGKLRWLVSTGESSVAHDAPLLVATPLRASHAMLYLYRPGSVYALDQREGGVRFRLGSK